MRRLWDRKAIGRAAADDRSSEPDGGDELEDLGIAPEGASASVEQTKSHAPFGE